MSRLEKLLARLQSKPVDFSWREFVSLMGLLGYELQKPERTSGSRRCFVHLDRKPIVVHEPHPNKVFKLYQVAQLLDQLRNERIL